MSAAERYGEIDADAIRASMRAVGDRSPAPVPVPVPSAYYRCWHGRMVLTPPMPTRDLPPAASPGLGPGAEEPLAGGASPPPAGRP